MRERLVMLVAIAIPLLVVTLGWPMFVQWITGAPSPQPPPEVAGISATPGAAAAQGTAAPAARPSPKPTVGAPGTLQAGRQPAATPMLTPAPTSIVAADRPQPAGETAISAADPTQAVSSFYALVSSHQFDEAVQLWTPQMVSAFPPQENIYQRFSNTQAIQLQRADVVSQDQSRATVAVDLVESDSQAGQRHYVGNWYVVRGPSGGWMLDQPDLRVAP